MAEASRKVQICYIQKESFVVDLSEIKRDSGFELLLQVRRELQDLIAPRAAILADLRDFEKAWTDGDDPQRLGGRFRFQKVHDAECARRGILLYEIYVQRGKFRAVVAWFDPEAPGVWVTIFKKQGNPQSKARLRTAGERAVNHWRQEYAGKQNDR